MINIFSRVDKLVRFPYLGGFSFELQRGLSEAMENKGNIYKLGSLHISNHLYFIFTEHKSDFSVFYVARYII